jgi:transglutaminase-like putative cysteine protease
VTSDLAKSRPAEPARDRPTLGQRPMARPPSTSRNGSGGPTAGSTLAMPAMGAIASICSATAISGVVTGFNWLSYSIVSVVVVVAAGTALRALRTPGPVIWLGQVFVLLCLMVTLFTSSGFLVVLPGPSAWHDLGLVFGQAGTDIQNGVPPVAGDQPILCLIVMSIGLVAVAVDTLAVTAKVPAAAGLILLCVYAVPASLDDQLLPWWSFVLGAAAFTVLLAVDGVQRHQAWRGKLGLPAVATTGVAPATVAVTAVAALLALFVGATFTLIGTVGRLPGADNGTGTTGQLGIKPFTVLQGMLGQRGTTELFDVTGLPGAPPYLQALTLPTYTASKGWEADTSMPPGVSANGTLPEEPGASRSDKTNKITITGVNWQDVWLPVFGIPKNLQDVSSGYRFDSSSGIVYSLDSRRPGTYTETADLTIPNQAELEAAGEDYSRVDPKYSKISGVDPRVTKLAQDITGNYVTELDKVQAVDNYFHESANDFSYSTQTAKPVTGDPLVDFLFYGKTGFCEQYASAMGVLLRSAGIPTRLAIGFTDGYGSGGHQTITSQDAHAWVQAYFPSYGWVNFDPTPLGDGRQQVPGYLNSGANAGQSGSAGRQQPDRQSGPTSTAPSAGKPIPSPTGDSGVVTSHGPTGPSAWQLWLVALLALVVAASTVMARRTSRPVAGPVARRWLTSALVSVGLLVFFAVALFSWWLAVLLLVLGLAAAPAVVRELRRRRHHQAIAERGPTAADAAWTELLAESLDRGMAVPPSDTLRVAAHRMVREHDLDAEGRESLRTLVGEVERAWYGGDAAVSPVVVESFDKVRRSLHRNAPLALRARLLPKSVLHPSRRRPAESDGDESDSS